MVDLLKALFPLILLSLGSDAFVPSFTPSSQCVTLPNVRSPTGYANSSVNSRLARAGRHRLRMQEVYFLQEAFNSDLPTAMQQTLSSLSSSTNLLSMDQDTAEALAGPFFGFSLFPYLAFIYFLNREENDTPKGVVVGFASCLSFVFLAIPAAIAAKVLYGVSLADSDWLHGSAESLLTITNLVTVIAFRQALSAKEQQTEMPNSATSYAPMTLLLVGLTVLAGATAALPALADPTVHTPYLGGFLDLPFDFTAFGANPEPENALTIATWVIHVSSLIEFLVAMGFCFRWGQIVSNPAWTGLTFGLIPLHSSGIVACTYHLFYNSIPSLVPLQAFLTCVGNTTAAWAAYRIAFSNGFRLESIAPAWLDFPAGMKAGDELSTGEPLVSKQETSQLVGFEDLGNALANDSDYSFLIKLFFGCTAASYAIKYGETFFDFPYEASLPLALAVIFIPSLLNLYKWNRRSKDPTFEGWF